MTAARRLAAILAADIVGYSRLMGEDEAGRARAVSEHRDGSSENRANGSFPPRHSSAPGGWNGLPVEGSRPICRPGPIRGQATRAYP